MSKNFRQFLLPIWICFSVIFGPFIAISQYLFTRGGGDLCDSVYVLPQGGYDPARFEEFARANHYADVLSSIALSFGILILIDYWSRKRGNLSLSLRITLTVLALVMMAGYVFILFVFSGAGQQVC